MLNWSEDIKEGIGNKIKLCYFFEPCRLCPGQQLFEAVCHLLVSGRPVGLVINDCETTFSLEIGYKVA